jgi:hypothetical protein
MQPPNNDGSNSFPSNGEPDPRFRHLKSPPLTPELRAWLDQQHTEEEIIAWVQELKEKGGLEFHEFFPELEKMATEP